MSLSTMSTSSGRRHRMLSATKDQAHFHSSNSINNAREGRKSNSPNSQGSAGSIQVKAVPTLRSTVVLVEKELVQNNIHKAEVLATTAINHFLDEPSQFRHLAATASGPKVVQALTPFWSLVTLLVQCKLLLFHQNIEENGGLGASEFDQTTPSPLSAPHHHHYHSRGHSRSESGTSNSGTHSRTHSNAASGNVQKHPLDDHQHHQHQRTNSSPPVLDQLPGITPQQRATLAELVAFLPKLFERLESIRNHSVPPQARILQTQVLRSLKRHHEALRYMEDSVLSVALETTAFVSDSDEGGESQPPSPTVSNGDNTGGTSGNATPQPRRDSSTPMPTVAPSQLRKNKKKNGTAAASDAQAGTPRYKPVEVGTISGAADSSRNDSSSTSSDADSKSAAKTKKKAKIEKRSTRILSWTPKTTLAAIEVYISICFESSSVHFNLGDDSGLQEPVAAEEVTAALDQAERRCIEFLSMHADAVNRRLRPCFPITMDSPSVFDEVLHRVENRHEKTLQVWNHQQMSFINNPVVHHASGPDTPPHRPYDPESFSGGEEGKSSSRSAFTLPLAFGGGNSNNNEAAVSRSLSDSLDAADDSAPATQRRSDALSNSSGRGIVAKVLATLRSLFLRLWRLVTSRKMGYAAVGAATLVTLYLFLTRLLQGQGRGVAISAPPRTALPVPRPAAAVAQRAASATQQAAARRVQAF